MVRGDVHKKEQMTNVISGVAVSKCRNTYEQ